ncbi:AAA family ATPase, partial [Acinetobacter baumannii]
LRQRLDDLAPLCEHFLAKFSEENGRKLCRVGPEALEVLSAYDWPGNIRELENMIERACVLAQPNEDELGPHHLPPRIRRLAA